MRKVGFMVKCKLCGKEFYTTPLKISKGRGKYCSVSCKGKVIVFAMLKVRGESWKRKMDIVHKKQQQSWKEDETKHPRWKGDEAGYFAMHDWITKHYGQPKKCEVCGLDDETRKYHWANIDGLYKRDIKNWKRMCVSCHRKYDYKNRRLSIT